jgi:hypothetical protein
VALAPELNYAMQSYNESKKIYEGIINDPKYNHCEFLVEWAMKNLENLEKNKPPALSLRKRPEPRYETAPQKKLRIREEFENGRFEGGGDTTRRVCGSDRSRGALLKEQNDTCAGLLYKDGYISCSSYPTDCDHMVELRHGGEDSIEYCQMLCYDCHHKKTKLNSKGQIVF